MKKLGANVLMFNIEKQFKGNRGKVTIARKVKSPMAEKHNI